MENYDPNLTTSGNMAKQTVKMRFQMWNYTHEAEFVTRGNTNGLSVITLAVEAYYWKLQNDQDTDAPEITMTAPNGDTLTVCDDEGFDKDTDILKDMLVSAEIVSIEADPEFWEKEDSK